MRRSWVSWAAFTCVPASALAASEVPLLAPSLCEASAVLAAPWDAGLVLVGDNEVDDQLYAFAREGERLVFRRSIPLPKEGRPHDIEALAAVAGQLLVVGSHGRARNGEPKPKRARLAFYAPGGAGDALRLVRALDDAARLDAARRDPAACLAALFVSPAPAQAGAVCRALVAAAPQIEGAAAFAGPGSAAPRVWLGLRTPLVEGRAVLLRLTPDLEQLRFDAIALADLGGRGVRELAVSGGMLAGIAGDGGDGGAPSRLWLVPLSDVRDGAALAPNWGEVLPGDAEGLLPLAAGAIVVVDVERTGGGSTPCSAPARQLFVTWPKERVAGR